MRASPQDDPAESIAAFLAAAKEPAVVEPGQEPIPLIAGSFNLDRGVDRLYLEAWTRDRTLSRRVTGVLATKKGSVQLSTERFGKREGILELIDLAAPKAQQAARKATRQTYREQFRRSLLRQFPGWRIAELSSDADLEHSLSPAYPRALLRRGMEAHAAIGCPPDAQDADGVLTFGLIWLDYLRRRESKLRISGLAVFVPEGRQRTTCLRLLHLRADTAQWSAFVYNARMEDRVDLRDYGNIDTTLPAGSGLIDNDGAWWTERLPGARFEPGGRLAWAVHGLEYARWEPQSGLTFGIDSKRKGQQGHLGEIQALARELARFRRAAASDRTSPLYLRKPELWLESQARMAIREIDASLNSAPVYRQAPAFAGGERSVLDLLAADHEGCLAVVEVKASEDPQLPLQALDYWIRVRWHAQQDDFRRCGFFPGISLQAKPPRLILVAPALSFHPTTEALVEHLSREVAVDTVGVGMDWRESIKVMFRKTRPARP